MALIARLKADIAQRLGMQRAALASDWICYLFLRPRGVELVASWGALLKQQAGFGKILQLLLSLLIVPSEQRQSLSQRCQQLAQSVAASAKGFSSRLPAIDFSRAATRLETASAQAHTLGVALKFLIAIVVLSLVWLMVTTPLPLWEQFLFFAVTLLITLALRKIPGNFATLAIICLSCVVTLRYGWWRLTSTMNLEYNSDYILGIPLLLAELYSWLVLFLGFVQTAWSLRRKRAELPADTNLWPSVDVFIPSYNEALSVVEPTVLAAMNMDWPSDRLTVYLLDDGDRPEFKAFAERIGVRYIARGENTHAKAGNLNYAMAHSCGEFIAIFDCDHLPVRNFLRATMGWFFKDSKCALVQTPHNFFSADPFERNFNNFRRVPNEGELFYGAVQDGNDLWNATFFCGSCAVLRREPLERIGGVAIETVTEDAHTALKLHRAGCTTAYINEIMASGLATESLSDHISQRIRWARGMAQVFRIDNPLFGKGLSLSQRLCYLNAMLYFFCGIPRLIFLTAPLGFLFFNLHIVDAPAIALILFALPHVMQSYLANSRLHGRYRFSFWDSIYEVVLAWYIVIPTTLALINPKLGKFNVTVKGGLIEKEYFDWDISRPYRVLMLLNFAGLAFGIVRFFWWNTAETGAVLLNVAWTLFNLATLGIALGVAAENRQVRRTHRVSKNLPAQIRFADHAPVACSALDFSLGGLGLQLAEDVSCPIGESLEVTLFDGEHAVTLPAHVIMRHGDKAGVQFFELSLQQEKDLLRCTFGNSAVWSQWRESHQPDAVFAALIGMLKLSWQGYARAFFFFGEAIKKQQSEWSDKLNRSARKTDLNNGNYLR